ncbi:response regulator transcription factor [Peptostreptococcus stomatis]
MDKILILEDEIGIRSFVSINLKREGYDVIEAGTGSEAIEKLNSEPNITVALLDIMLPDMSGVDVCRYIREKYENMGIIMLTAKAQEDDKIEGFVAGADDYMIKPFSIKELLFRVSALIRRVKKDNDTRKSSVLDLAPFSLDINKRKLYKDGNVVDLTPTEFSIVKFLMMNASDSLSRDQILQEVWGSTELYDYKIVDVNIRRIRNKIEEDPSKPKYILTAWGYGYTFRRAD